MSLTIFFPIGATDWVLASTRLALQPDRCPAKPTQRRSERDGKSRDDRLARLVTKPIFT